MTISAQAIQEAVEALAEVRRTGQRLAGLPAGCRPESLEDGYAIQDAFIAAWDEPVAGWKVGATSSETQAMFATAEPFYGPVFAPRLLASPAAPPAAAFPMRAIECEFAFRLAADFEPRAKPFERDEVAERLGALLPAIELVESRLDDPIAYGAAAAIADCGVNGALVLGREIPDWRQVDLARQAVRLTVDEDVRAEGTGSLVLGHPLNVLVWFVNRHTGRGHHLEAGQVVSTGTCTGLSRIEPGQSVIGDYGALGRAEVRFV